MQDEQKKKPDAFKRAVALRYDAKSEAAPRIVAKGQRLLAEKIIALAQQHNIPVHPDPDLSAVLAQLEVGVEIPPELYQAVAEILAFVYRLNRKMRKSSP